MLSLSGHQTHFGGIADDDHKTRYSGQVSVKGHLSLALMRHFFWPMIILEDGGTKATLDDERNNRAAIMRVRMVAGDTTGC